MKLLLVKAQQYRNIRYAFSELIKSHVSIFSQVRNGTQDLSSEGINTQPLNILIFCPSVSSTYVCQVEQKRNLNSALLMQISRFDRLSNPNFLHYCFRNGKKSKGSYLSICVTNGEKDFSVTVVDVISFFLTNSEGQNLVRTILE